MGLYKYLLFALAGLFLLQSCNKNKKLLNKSELQKYINNPKNGLVKKQEVNGFTIKVSVHPASLMINQELNNSSRKDTAIIHAIEKKYKDYKYFFLEYSKNGKEAIRQLENFSRYSEMLQVLAFKMHPLINITTPFRDTVALADYQYEQQSGMGGGNLLMLVFPVEKLSKTKIMELNIAECGFGIGDLKFQFRKEDLEKVPELIY